MNIQIKSVPHNEQRYDTVGDWMNILQVHKFPNISVLTISVSAMENPDYEFLVALHELVESWLCNKRGITMQTVDKWDLAFPDEEPGDAPTCPYHKEHEFAKKIEKEMAEELGVDWQEYEHTLGAVK